MAHDLATTNGKTAIGLAHVLRARNVARNVTRKERSSCQDVEFLRGSSRSRPCRWCLGKD